jgi:hypothetical protein
MRRSSSAAARGLRELEEPRGCGCMVHEEPEELKV